MDFESAIILYAIKYEYNNISAVMYKWKILQIVLHNLYS